MCIFNYNVCTYWRLLEIWYIRTLANGPTGEIFIPFFLTVFRLASAPPIIRLTILELTIFNRELVSSGSKSLFVGDLQADKKFFSNIYGLKESQKFTQIF